MLSLLKRSYYKLFSADARARLWRMRARMRRQINGFQNFWRRLFFYFTGRCKACQGKHLDRFRNRVIETLDFTFYRCRDCGFIFVYPLPDLSTTYTETTAPEFGEGEAVWNGHYLSAINQHTKGTGKLLEIGFGDASFLKLAHDRGWEVYGTELSPILVKHAQEDLGLPNIGHGTVEGLRYQDDFFDVVAGFNFIEHVPDPRKTLSEILRILRPSGVLVLMCPNISGIYHHLMPEILADNDPLKITWVLPAHLSYFNKTNLGILMESVGFSLVGDESRLMNSLWQQFEVNIGPEVTENKLRRLVAEIQSSSAPPGDARVSEYGREIKDLLVERMTWTMLSDLTELEPLLGAEVGILLVGRKPAR
jgi:SAM-dependent methyltransferase